jgi:hypothetical protein
MQEAVPPIRLRRLPTGMTEDEEIVYDFSTELHKNKHVSEATFARADKRFGKKGVVDLTGINAYYTLLAMQLNVAQYVAPDYATKIPRFPGIEGLKTFKAGRLSVPSRAAVNYRFRPTTVLQTATVTILYPATSGQ